MDVSWTPCAVRLSAILLLAAVAKPVCADDGPASRPAAGASDAKREMAEYDAWTRPLFHAPRRVRPADGKDVATTVVITVVDGEQKPPKPDMGRPWDTLHRCHVYADQRVGWTTLTQMGAKGGGLAEIPPDDWKRIGELIGELPDDQTRLPPPGRRLMVQIPDGGEDGRRSTVRVYDRANPPDGVLELLRLTRSGIGLRPLVFAEPATTDAGGFDHGGFLCLSPDGRQIVASSGRGPIRFYDPATRKLLKQVAIRNHVLTGNTMLGASMEGITLSPDGTLAAIECTGACRVIDTRTWTIVREMVEWGDAGHDTLVLLTSPRFTPDGRRLLLERGRASPVRVFDTKTWEPRDDLPALPDGARAYVQAPGGKRAVYVSKDGAVGLWDVDGRRPVATLDEEARLARAVFSPDETLVAVVTVHPRTGGSPERWRIRIRDTGSGKLVHELRPFEQDVCEVVESLAWSPDGRYILAATKSHRFFTSRGISLWNARSGRHRGEFTGCPTDVTGVALLPDGSQLVAGCHDGKIRLWDFAGAVRQVRDLEDSLGG